MIHSKCAELLFLIGCVLVHVGESNFVDKSRSKNNKPFFMNRFDDIIGNGSGIVDDRFKFTTMSLPSDSKRMPALSNGHLGFIVFSDSIYLNALYNGHGGLSHRARIPNFGCIQLADCQTHNCKYTFNVKYGYFMVEMNVENQFIATHLIYAHRYYDRAMINQFYIQRTGSRGEIKLKLKTYSGCNDALGAAGSGNTSSDDLKFTKNETIHLNDSGDFQLLCGHIMEKEGFTGEEPMRQEEDVCVLWNHVPEELTLDATASSISYKFVMAVDIQEADVRQEIVDVFSVTNDELLIKHIAEWKKFWNNFRIEIDGDDELLRAITSSMFNIVCNLPSEHTNLPQHPFYGLSPTGLSRGGGSDMSDYEGHNFWDTEIFMFPPIALINHNWAKRLLYYRFIMLDSAKEIAKNNGYKGAQYPWESSAIGFETVQPGYEYIAKYQIHNTADISFAMQQYFGLTNDVEWAEDEGCEIAEEIARFWASRVTFNESKGVYDIENIMGPDEDNFNISNNVYTNVVAAKALKFGALMRGLCGNNETDDESSKWLEIAEKIKIEYDEELDYHPEFEGYVLGGEVKQADTILIGYPLMHPMKESTRRNDLNFYLNATRLSGPAMTHSMFSINYLDIGDLSDGNKMLEKSYKPYIKSPFNVWFEVIDGVDENFAGNFITGAGGFLQCIFNGFFGLRIHLDFLEIKKPNLPNNSTSMKFRGIKYLNSTIEMRVGKFSTDLKITKLGDDLDLMIDNNPGIAVEENFSYNLAGFSSVKIMRSSLND